MRAVAERILEFGAKGHERVCAGNKRCWFGKDRPYGEFCGISGICGYEHSTDLSGGVGSRLGADIPKQYIKVGNRMILSYCVEQLSMHPQIDAIQIVAQESWREPVLECVAAYDSRKKFKAFQSRVKTGSFPVWNGLRDIFTYAKAEDTVLIHDAARPCLSEALIRSALASLEGHVRSTSGAADERHGLFKRDGKVCHRY